MSSAQAILKPFKERLSKEVPVSGRFVVGAMLLHQPEASWRPDDGFLVTWRPTAGAKGSAPICVTLASREGNYFGEGELRDAMRPGWTYVTPTQRPAETLSFLSGLGASDLAMLAVQGDCDSVSEADSSDRARLTVFVIDSAPLARSTRAAGEPSVIRLFLNSMAYTLNLTSPLAGLQADCRSLDDVRRNKSFNTICEIRPPAGALEAEIDIGRRRNERGFQALKYRLVWDSPR